VILSAVDTKRRPTRRLLRDDESGQESRKRRRGRYNVNPLCWHCQLK